MNEEYYKDRICDLEARLRRITRCYEEAKSALGKAEDRLCSAEYKIRNELEPRIRQEERAYDRWATDGAGDECFRSGMNGKCGPECEAFLSKPECLSGTNTI